MPFKRSFPFTRQSIVTPSCVLTLYIFPVDLVTSPFMLLVDIQILETVRTKFFFVFFNEFFLSFFKLALRKFVGTLFLQISVSHSKNQFFPKRVVVVCFNCFVAVFFKLLAWA